MPERDPPPPRRGGDYWTESRQPLTSLIFIAPLLAVYEAGMLVYETGVLALRAQATRNGADVWLRQMLDAVGFRQYFLLPVLTVCILLAWHYVLRRPWRFSRGTLTAMTGECVVLALVLWLVLQLQGMIMQTVAGELRASISRTMGTIIGYFGAGIYEELLFRLVLLSLVIAVLRWLRLSPRQSTIAAVVLTSLAFAGAHYIGQFGESLQLFTFLFRFLAGIFFAVLFLYRGFGIAAGTHAMYDILVGVSWLLQHPE